MYKVLPLPIEHNSEFIYPVLIDCGENLYLVDTGFPGQGEDFKSAVTQAGYDFSRITGIILTHQDMDHIGSIIELRQMLPDVRLYAHKDEAPYINGEKTPVKVAKREKTLSTMTEDEKAFFHSFKAAYQQRITHIDILPEDGEVIDKSSGLLALHIPGHTPGHLCLYAPWERTLISGDALNAKEGELMGPAPQHSMDILQARKSLEKLLELDIDKVVCYHGGLCTGDIRRRILELSQE